MVVSHSIALAGVDVDVDGTGTLAHGGGVHHVAEHGSQSGCHLVVDRPQVPFLGVAGAECVAAQGQQ